MGQKNLKKVVMFGTLAVLILSCAGVLILFDFVLHRVFKSKVLVPTIMKISIKGFEKLVLAYEAVPTKNLDMTGQVKRQKAIREFKDIIEELKEGLAKEKK